MAGTLPSADEVNNLVGAICRDIDMLMARVAIMQAWLVTVDLTAAPYSMASADNSLIKSAFTDLFQLRQLYMGNGTLATAKDFRTFAQQLHGPSI